MNTYDQIIQNIIEQESTILNERVITRGNKNKINITVHGDGYTYVGFLNNPYFKIYDGNDFDHSKRKTRISVLRPEYIIHNNNIWTLNTSLTHELMKTLTYQEDDGDTVWRHILKEIYGLSAQYVAISNQYKETLLNLPMPDYYQLHYSDKDRSKYGNRLK